MRTQFSPTGKPLISPFRLRFHRGVRLLIDCRNKGSDASDGLVQIGVNDAAGRFFDSAHEPRGAFFWQAPKADKNESTGEQLLEGLRHFADGAR